MASLYGGYRNHGEPHFLDACFLCRKPLGLTSDIFMYRGNTPFCSKECRQQQIESDEARAKEKSCKPSSSARSIRKSESKTPAPSKTVRTDTVVVA